RPGYHGPVRRSSSGALLAAFLGAVLAATLFAVVDALQVERATDDVIADTRQVFDAAATDQHDGVLLQVVAFAADVCPDFVAIRKTDTSNLAQGGVRFFGCFGRDF